jgi:pilT protein domain protein
MLMSFEYVYTPNELENDLFYIRDIKDYPVLYTAIIEDIDILITGDKDFSDINIHKPEIMSPSQFMEETMKKSL